MSPKPRLPKPKPLIECFEGLPDPRMDRTRRHKLIDILVIGLCSLLTGGESFTDMELFGRTRLAWLKTFLELPHDIPSHDTFTRVFSALDTHAFLQCFVQWVQGVCPGLTGTVAIDGKSLRRAHNEGESIPCIVSAWASEAGVALGQVQVDDKSNEITAVPQLLDMLILNGCIVTLDAMGCQKDIADHIIEKKADYVLSLKGNHGTAHREVRDFFDDAVPPAATQPARTVTPGTMQGFETVEKNHGRIETRRYWQSTDIDWFADQKIWKGLRSFGMVESTRIVKNKTTTKRRLFLSSLPLDVQAFAHAVRSHWGIENSLHWSLDVTFREDDSRARTRHAAQNVATLRRIALNLIKTDRSKNSSQRYKRIIAALDHTFLEQLLGI